ncbi:MAG: hypothetical protein C9356_11935 [Oleiphilus sp.]|nr:MAG: hypothetical protein C9356_11935 [Oleiphilus sp.]
MSFESAKSQIESSGKLAELATKAVGDMGDIFWDAADHGETDNLPEDIAEECVRSAILGGLKDFFDSQERNDRSASIAYQKESAIASCEARIDNGAESSEAFNWLRDELSRIEGGEAIYD